MGRIIDFFNRWTNQMLIMSNDMHSWVLRISTPKDKGEENDNKNEREKLKEELRIMYQCFTKYRETCKRDCKWDICPLKLEEENDILSPTKVGSFQRR